MRWASIIDSVSSGFAIAAHRLRRRRRRRQQDRDASIPWWVKFGLATMFGSLAAAHATTVTPPSFPELVAESQVIARGTVADVSSRWVDGAEGRMIKTFVTFHVENTLKGSPADPLTLEFLGGTVGTDTLHVSGMPQFKVGEKEILFVTGNGVQFCPLVRLMHGRYHVRTDAASHRAYVAADDDTPLTSVADVQRSDGGPRRAAQVAGTAPALTPEDFESQVAAEVAHSSAQ